MNIKAGAQRLSVTAGALLRITGSHLIACSVSAIHQDKHRSAVLWPMISPLACMQA